MYSISNSFYFFGAGTEIGKTVLCGMLSKIITEKYKKSVHYIKPIDTGSTEIKCIQEIHSDLSHNRLHTSVFYSYHEMVSPHRIFQQSKQSDHVILKKIKNILKEKKHDFIFIEGAGGIGSPTLDGSLQCALYSKVKLPIVFIADFRLGGISNTIANITLARNFGFEISCILCFDGEHENVKFLKNYYKKDYHVFEIKNFSADDTYKSLYEKNFMIFDQIANFILNYSFHEYSLLNFQKKNFLKHAWWPFTQHNNIKSADFIHSAIEDSFQMIHFDTTNHLDQNTQGLEKRQVQEPLNKFKLDIQEKVDATQSWWTQNLGHGHPILAQETAHAVARYGHVMFPGYIHAPAANLIEKCLSTVGKGWATRVFFSDNGSTSVEVALKMAFRLRFGTSKPSKSVVILGLKNSYHGDTLGALDATEPNSFKEKEYWYHKSRGVWISYPQVYLKNKKIYVHIDYEMETPFSSFNELFSYSKRRGSDLEKRYQNYLKDVFENLPNDVLIGACLFEGIVQGACGMIFVDPLFLRLLTLKCNEYKIPVIVDEVFSGFWRLGYPAACQALKVKPDIACFAKGLTGGVLPMAVTLTSEKVFNSFLSDSLADALLHGHSYSGNPVGAAVANKSIELLQGTPFFNDKTSCLKMMWNRQLVNKLSTLTKVKRVIVLGTLLGFELMSDSQDYLSTQSQLLVSCLKQTHHLEVRPLGNVVYIIASMNSSREHLNHMIKTIILELCK